MSLADLRDIAIIILAGLAILQLLVLLILTTVVYRKMVPLLDKLGGVLDATRSTAATVAGTSVFVGEAVVSPIIRIASVAAGVRRGVTALGRLLRRKETEA